MIIGITGTNSAGKDSVAAILKQRGFAQFSCSDVLREEAKAKGLQNDAITLGNLADHFRQTKGSGILGKMVGALIKASGAKDAVVTSIRNPQEAKELKAQDGFFLVWIDAPVRVRYERSQSRKRDAYDRVTFDDFMKYEQRIRDDGPAGQRLDLMKEMADLRLENDGSFDELNLKVLSFLDSLGK